MPAVVLSDVQFLSGPEVHEPEAMGHLAPFIFGELNDGREDREERGPVRGAAARAATVLPCRSAPRVRTTAGATPRGLWNLVTNGLMVTGGWLLLSPAVRAALFGLQGPLAFAVTLESWMLADTAGTNMLAEDAAAARAAIPSRGAVQHLLRVKTVALACLIGPLCAVVCLAIALYDGRYASGVAVAVVLLTLPFGVIVLSAWLGTVLPFHPRSLRWRWSNRRPWWHTVRWALLCVAPYGVVPPIALGLLAPSLILGLRPGRGTGEEQLSGWGLAVAARLACLLASAAFLLGPRLIARLVARRRLRLDEYLADPDRG
jgi:hypothetical protein